jgi:hypothetical protein
MRNQTIGLLRAGCFSSNGAGCENRSLILAVYPDGLRSRHPRPTYGMLVAMTVIESTFASSGRFAI